MQLQRLASPNLLICSVGLQAVDPGEPMMKMNSGGYLLKNVH